MPAQDITPAQMAQAKADAAELLRIREQKRSGRDVDPRVVAIVEAAADDSDPRVLLALIIALVQFGWMAADFLTRSQRGHELNADELDLLIELHQADAAG